MRFQPCLFTTAVLAIGVNAHRVGAEAIHDGKESSATNLALDCSAILTPDQRADEATVRRIEHDWLAAEVRGDTQFLRCLLGNDYVNIGKDGKMHAGSDIIAHAEKNRGSTREVPSLESSVIVNGEVATAYSLTKTRGANGELLDVHFVDSFVFRAGRWYPYCGVDL